MSKDEKDRDGHLPHVKLPDSIQKTLDSEQSWWELVSKGEGGDSTDSNARYAAYAARARTILLSVHRYVAYTSDIGESFRPVAHPYLIKGAYGVSWAYLIGDVSHEGYKAYIRNERIRHPEAFAQSDDKQANVDAKESHGASSTSEAARAAKDATKDLVQPAKVAPIDDYRTVMAQRAIFQGLASMGLPAFTIHSIVKYSGKAFKNAANTTIRTWGPIGLGLACVPALPYVFDEPVEKAVEWTFHNGFKAFGGEGAVSEHPKTKTE